MSRSQNLMSSGSLSSCKRHPICMEARCTGSATRATVLDLWGVSIGGVVVGVEGLVGGCRRTASYPSGFLDDGPWWLGRLEANCVLHDVLDQVNHRLYAGDPAILQPTMRLEREGRRRAAPSSLGFLCRVPALLLVSQLLLAPQVLGARRQPQPRTDINEIISHHAGRLFRRLHKTLQKEIDQFQVRTRCRAILHYTGWKIASSFMWGQGWEV